MKLKNISSKLISVGETAILPGKTEEVSGFDNNPVVDALVKAKQLAIIKTKAPAARGK